MEKVLLEGFGMGFPNALTGDVTFSWKVVGCFGKQEEYRLVILNENDDVVWDSGRVKSSRSAAVETRIQPFYEDSLYQAYVTVITDEKKELSSEKLVFWSGIKPESWQSVWIKHCKFESSAPMFRNEFWIKKPVKHARLYYSAMGYIYATMNGRETSGDMFTPQWTNPDKRVCYAVNDVTELIKEGKNVAGFEVGRGWACAMTGHTDDQYACTAELMLHYQDGTVQCLNISYQNSWKVYSDGPVVAGSIYHGEIYDARKELPGWNTAAYEAKEEDGWKPAVVTEGPSGIMCPQDEESIRKVTVLYPVKTVKSKDSYIIDFGQNISGLVEMEIDEPRDIKVLWKHAEILDKETGHVNMANLRSAKATDEYISNGKKAVYSPHYTYHGFRYMEISGLTNEKSLKTIRAYQIRSDVSTRGTFSCSNELINKIQSLCFWTEGNNLYWVPTDCPQRDERLGWLNDLTVRAEESVYNYDLHRFFTSYIQCIADEQGKRTGAITDTAPFVRYGSQPADPVCSSYLILGWLMYRNYGDIRTVEKYYDGYAAWTDFLWNISDHGIVAYSLYGDWAAPIATAVADSYGSGAVSNITPGSLMSTGFLYYNAVLMLEMAKLLKKPKDIEHWQQVKDTTNRAIQDTFYHPDTFDYGSGSQASNTFIMWLGLAQNPTETIKRIVADIEENGIHTTTGNICSRYIYEVLTENGYVDMAYQLVNQTTYPSWGYMVENGATTTWERWEYVDSGRLLGMASHDHPMYSTISCWFYRYLAGICEYEPAFEKILISPYFPKGLTHVESELETIKGTVRSKWEREKDEVSLEVEIPFNAEGLFQVNGICSRMIVNGFAQTQGQKTVALSSGVHVIKLYLSETE